MTHVLCQVSYQGLITDGVYYNIQTNKHCKLPFAMHAIAHTIACSNNAIAIHILLIPLHFSIAIIYLLYSHWYSDLVLQNTFSFIHYYFYYIVNCCMYRAATGGINLLKQWPGDKPAMQNNIWFFP